MIELSGRAGELHRWSPAFERPEVRVVSVDRPAIVLGSTQPDDAVDADRARQLGFEVVRRRSGGGAVELGSESLWVDVALPASDPSFTADIGHAAEWMGGVWVDALVGAGVVAESLSVHSGTAVAPREGRVVCFAGVGSGEVLMHGRKVVGISQRRSRSGVWFQCVAYRRWAPSDLLATIRLPNDAECSVESITARCRDHVSALTVEPAGLLDRLDAALQGGTAPH